MTCPICNSDKLLEGKIDGSTRLPFSVQIPIQSFPYVQGFSSKLDATVCKECGNIVQVKVRNLEGLKKLEDVQ